MHSPGRFLRVSLVLLLAALITPASTPSPLNAQDRSDLLLQRLQQLAERDPIAAIVSWADDLSLSPEQRRHVLRTREDLRPRVEAIVERISQSAGTDEGLDRLALRDAQLEIAILQRAAVVEAQRILDPEQRATLRRLQTRRNVD